MRNDAKQSNHTPEAINERRLLAELGIRICTTCNQTKDLTEFHKSVKGTGGLASICKDCQKAWDKSYQKHHKAELIFRINKAILKRQNFETHVCWLVDKSAHQAGSHLQGEYGLMSETDAREFRSIFMNNMPEKIRKLEVQFAERAKAKATRLAATVARNADSDAAKIAAKLEKQAGKVAALTLDQVTDEMLDKVIYLRMKYHLKNKRRRLNATEISFTKLNFTKITGYEIWELREHLRRHMPNGKSWLDVISGDLHIEHVMPSAAFDLTTITGVRNCYAISNLTLLCGSDNVHKGLTVDKQTVAHFRGDIESARLFGLVE